MIRKNGIFALIMAFIVSIAGLLSTGCFATPGVALPRVSDYYKERVVVERKELRVGLTSGSYGEMFNEIIAPLLNEKGYTFELVYYDNVILPNFDLAEGKIDLNIFQNIKYLNTHKFANDNDLAIQAITEIPTAPMAVYSREHNSFSSLRRGATVSIPSDATNKARALKLLESARLIKIDPFIDKSKATENDLIENRLELEFITADMNKLPITLNYCDISVIAGSYAISDNLNLSDALIVEDRYDDDYKNVIVVRNEDIGEQFSLDIIDAVYSIEFFNQITADDSKYKEYAYPRHFYKMTNQ
ncbi:MAG: MetQ/NlpA family ABC transporter substrate-binding protein [Oscillospiraceae bacterium]|nr:MetQ/NlpA family ABC transporter substrate-binding protein [Oscillospiraceae bacterium]